MLQLGIVGCGRVTTMFHLKAIEEVEGVALVAVADRNRPRMERVKEKSHAERGYVDYRDLVSDPEVDVVVINTPPHLHEEMVLRSLRAGKHVLCEKPLARSVEGCLHIKGLQEEAGLVVLPGHNYAFTPSLERVQALIREGAIGEVARISVRFENNLRRYGSKSDFRLRTDFGIVEDVLPHILSVTHPLAGVAEKVVELEGWRESYDVVDNMRLRLRTDRGVELDCFMSWTRLIPRFRVEVAGTSGRVETDLMRSPFGVTIDSGGGRRRIAERRGLRLYLDLLRFKHPSFQRQYRHLRAIVAGVEEPRITVDDEAEMIGTMERVAEHLSETVISKP
ncbi:MAG: Gfo/Idh/MocA family protein [Candidatus Bathyarchaeia archaeon]